MSITVVVGNPGPGSRTRHAAELLARRLHGAPGEESIRVIELADLGPRLLGWGDRAVADAKQAVLDSDVVIFASPTFKATYSGLLKLFLDQFAADELTGTLGIPLMLGAAPHHALAPEFTLKPVLVEIGCSCPTPALYLIDSDYESPPQLDAWLERARVSLPGVRT